MSVLESGMLVRHASLGLGKIVAVEERAVHVFFVGNDARFATKLRLPAALPFLERAASANAWLSGLTGFAFDEKAGRYGLARTWLSHADATARFLGAFPKGFADPRYGERPDKLGRAAQWRRGHEAYRRELGGGEGVRLLAAADVDGLVERALRVEKTVRPLLKSAEQGFEDCLKRRRPARDYFAALFEVLAARAPAQARFESLAAAVAAMSPGASEESRWTLVTLLPFLARPASHMLLRPRFAGEVAHRLGLELAYEPQPNWSTYSALLGSSARLLEKLRPLGARDYVDVEVFMRVVTTRPVGPKREPPLVT